MPRPDLSALTWPRRIGMRLESTSVATSLGKDGTWLDDNTWAPSVTSGADDGRMTEP